jgi:hypothetical protein
MKAIIDSITGELLFTTNLDIDQTEGTVVLEDNPTGNYWDFENQVWYNVIDTEFLTQQALEIDLLYTGLISDLLRKHIEKLSIDGIPIPQDVIDERDRLRAECNQKILDLGITNFSYRQQNLKL